ncbi:hypothetical protein KGB36_gp46 [Shigella phage Sf11 SMD-2017]|uniref:Uncharacterized protein n=1 Tax=Shigella phage Sf11 SMD-2017 TaxID=2282196 RepID=A0A291AXF6_9CAUD|nr:hypothetical protein KGB36_gp46 [Shigella phage Sf11 SMD-2017]ATE85706.1 hypothetical protein Sf11_gp59 [Shigella phage Sf11 SMD-2017]
MTGGNNLYAERDIDILDETGGFYSQHVSAMTSESLHSKSAIAAELAYRDMLINELVIAVQQVIECYDSAGGKVWTTSSKRRALDNARAAVNKALGETK